MAEDRYQLAAGAAELYERQKVPAIFRPLAEATVAAIGVAPQDEVLDLACGTGIVARERWSPFRGQVRGSAKLGSDPRHAATS